MFRSRSEIITKAKSMGFRTHEEEEIRPGDTYIVWRNADPVLLTCQEVREDDEKWRGWVIPREEAYYCDIPECVKVTL